MAPVSSASRYRLVALMPSFWLAIYTLMLGTPHKPPGDHIEKEEHGISLQKCMLNGSGLIPQQAPVTPHSLSTFNTYAPHPVERTHLERSVFLLASHKTKTSDPSVALLRSVEAPSSTDVSVLESHKTKTSEGDKTSTTRQQAQYWPCGGLLAESLWVWNHCKQGSVLRGRPIQLMLFVLGCWWRGLGNLMSILSDPAAFLCVLSPRVLANACVFVVASLAATLQIYARFVLSTLMFGLVVGLSMACLCWKLTWVAIACTWAVVLLVQRTILAGCIRVIVRFSDMFCISWHMESAMWRTAFRLLRPGVLAASFHLLTSPTIPSAAMTCFACLLLNFDELANMPRTLSLLLHIAWRAAVFSLIGSCASRPVAYVAALVLVSGVVYHSLHLRSGVMCRVASAVLSALVLTEYGMTIAILGGLLAVIMPSCMEQFDDNTQGNDRPLVEMPATFRDEDDVDLYGEFAEVAAAPPKRRRLGRKSSDPAGGGNDIQSFLRDCQKRAHTSQALMQKDEIQNDSGVVDDIKKAYELVNKEHAAWSTKLKDLAVACICVHNVRATEFSVIEQVVMLYIAEGTDRIRCHDGEAHMYNNGAHVVFNGLVSQGALKRVRMFMKLLEGLFKALPKQAALPETNKALLTQINSVYHSMMSADDPYATVAGCEDQILMKLNQKAHYATKKGKAAGKGKKKHGGDGILEEDGSDHDDVNWTDNLSRSFARLVSFMNRDLLNKTILPYCIEWCQTEKKASESFCLKDKCMKFVKDHEPFLTEVKKNQYPHILRPP